MSWLDSVFGQKPKVAKPRYVNLGTEQQTAIGANIAAMPQTAKLGDLYSSYLQSALAKQGLNLTGLVKGGSDLAQQEQTVASQELSGQIPQDVQDQIMRSGAYQNLISGGGGDFLRSLQARDLGLTSLQLQGQGAQMAAQAGNAAQQWTNIAGSTVYNPSQMYITPQQQAAVTAANNLLRQNYQQLKYNVAAAPDPAAKGISDTLISLLQAYLSKGGGSQGAQNPYSTEFGGMFASNQGGVYPSTALPWDTTGGTGGVAVGGGYNPDLVGPDYFNTDLSGSDFNVAAVA